MWGYRRERRQRHPAVARVGPSQAFPGLLGAASAVLAIRPSQIWINCLVQKVGEDRSLRSARPDRFRKKTLDDRPVALVRRPKLPEFQLK